VATIIIPWLGPNNGVRDNFRQEIAAKDDTLKRNGRMARRRYRGEAVAHGSPSAIRFPRHSATRGAAR